VDSAVRGTSAGLSADKRHTSPGSLTPVGPRQAGLPSCISTPAGLTSISVIHVNLPHLQTLLPVKRDRCWQTTPPQQTWSPFIKGGCRGTQAGTSGDNSLSVGEPSPAAHTALAAAQQHL
uniref:Uncharacterized protein n=1 Tax=Salarias fasciatus TaxID=181472 RepID=A0A672GZG6_SALFA